MIACAGVGMPTLLGPVNGADVAAMPRVDVLGLVHALAAVMPGMLRRCPVRLTAVSGLAAHVGRPGESGYRASRAAVYAYLPRFVPFRPSDRSASIVVIYG
jgi:NADP-dependent 3-hydroxy acid dehydrogenase YdfG